MKQTLLRVLQQTAHSLPLSWLRACTRQRFVIPFYHVISNQDLPHIKHLYAIKNEQDFIADLDYLCQHFTPVTLTQVVKYIYQGQTLPQNAFLLTFDDGLSECYHVIAPILKRKGIPATFFLNSDFVDNRALMFRYKASFLLEHCLQHNIPAQVLKPHFKAYHLICQDIKDLLSVRWPERNLFDRVAADLGIDFEQFLKEVQPYLTLNQIQSMQEDGFYFGSHSINHPTYNILSLDDQIAQTQECQNWLDQHIRPKHRVFAFPFTDFKVNSDFFDSILQKEKFDLTFGGAGLRKECIKGQLQRFALESTPKMTAKQMLHTEYAYYMLKAFFGKNTIRRQ